RKISREEALSGKHGPSGLRIAKISEMTPVIRQIMDMVKDRGNYRSYDDIANWLNDAGISTGPYCQLGEWTGKLVADLVKDDILAGFRTHRKMIHTRIYKTGEYRRNRNVAPEKVRYPELAHLSVEEFEDLQVSVGLRAV